MIIRQFLAQTQYASAARRAEAATALAKAYLYGNLSAEEAWEAKTALLALLDDPSPLVRRALAETCAPSARTPRPLAVALSCDVAEVAGPILTHSPVLTDPDLVEAAALGCDGARALIAARHDLGHAVSGALAEIGDVDTLVALAGNPTARITAGRLLRMVERFGDDPALRETLLARPGLPPEVRYGIGLALAQTLTAFAAGCGWLGPDRCERIGRETGERAALDVCADSDAAEVARLVRHLRTTRQLNAGLVLRATLSGRADFVTAALAELSGLDHAAVGRSLRDPRGYADLHGRAGLPAVLLPAMQAATSTWREAAAGATTLRGASLSRRMIERAITACEIMPAAEMRAVAAVLNRYEAEAARDEAREAARTILAEAISRETAGREAEAADHAWCVAPEDWGRIASATAATPVTVEASMPEPVADALPTHHDVSVPEAPAAEIAFAPEPAGSQPFNPVGNILDALPGQILERFFAERERPHAVVAGDAEARERTAADAVFDGLEAGLLAEYRAGRAAGPAMKIAA